MNSLKQATMTAYPLNDKFRRNIDRCLNLLAPPEGATYADLGALGDLDRFIWAMLQADDDPYQIRVEKRTTRVRRKDVLGRTSPIEVVGFPRVAYPNVSNPAARRLSDLMRQFPRRNEIPSPTHPAVGQLTFAPHIRLFLTLFHDHPIRDYIGGQWRLNCPVADGVLPADIYNDFVKRFRCEMLARNLLRRDLHNWNLGSRENVANLDAYLDGLCATRDLTVYHFWLYHARARSNLVTTSVENQHSDLQVLRACRAKFFDCMRRKPSLFTEDPGYVWFILPTLEGGYALHLTLLFDSAALRKVIDDKRVEAEQAGVLSQDHANEVGAYWVETATGGLGSFQRSDKIINFYSPEWVFGEVRSGDYVRREKLKETLGHLAMRRALVRLKNEPRGQYFGLPNRRS